MLFTARKGSRSTPGSEGALVFGVAIVIEVINCCCNIERESVMSCYRVWAVLAAVTAALSSSGNALAGPGVAQVPEPTTLALFAMGAIGTLGAAWVKSRRRK
jgi:hypothetical protein